MYNQAKEQLTLKPGLGIYLSGTFKGPSPAKPRSVEAEGGAEVEIIGPPIGRTHYQVMVKKSGCIGLCYLSEVEIPQLTIKMPEPLQHQGGS